MQLNDEEAAGFEYDTAESAAQEVHLVSEVKDRLAPECYSGYATLPFTSLRT